MSIRPRRSSSRFKWFWVIFLVLGCLGVIVGWRETPLDRNLFFVTIFANIFLDLLVDVRLTANRDKSLVLLPIWIATSIALAFYWNSETLFYKSIILIGCIIEIDSGLDRLFTDKLKRDRRQVARGILFLANVLFVIAIGANRASHHDYLIALLLGALLLLVTFEVVWKSRERKIAATENASGSNI